MQMVQLVLETAHYRSGEELLEYEKKLQQIHKSTGFLRNKKRADYLVHNCKYKQAIELYNQILNSDNKPQDSIIADVYHNLGVIYAKLFYYEKAAEYFLKSFVITPSTESLKQYKLALKLAGKEDTNNEAMLDLPSVKQLDTLIDDEIQSISDSLEQNNDKIASLKHVEKFWINK